MKWNGLLLLVFLLLSFSVSLFSEVVLTDEEYEIILNTLEQSILDLEASEEAISELKKDLINSEKIIVMLKEERTISDDIISLLKVESDLQLTSLKMQRTENLIHDIKMFGLGFVSGNLTGIPTGIKLGVSF